MLRRSSDKYDDTIPMIEIFGGAFAFLMILFIILNLLTETNLLTILEEKPDEGEYKIDWGASGEGYVIITFPDRIKILENNTTVNTGEICRPNSAFQKYARSLYNEKKKQIIFTILEGSVKTMAIARNCLQSMYQNRPISIGWIIANTELLKSVSLDQIPFHIENVITE